MSPPARMRWRLSDLLPGGAVGSALGDSLGRRRVRIGVTGLARAGKTAFLTSLAANLLALSRGRAEALPAFSARIGGLPLIRASAAAADPVPRFDLAAHLAALSRLRRPEFGDAAASFLAFADALPAKADSDETLARSGHALYVGALQTLRDRFGLSFLQPGRFLMPPPGPTPPWMGFFPYEGRGGMGRLLGQRYDAYRGAIAADLTRPLFASIDRLVVLADLLTPLHRGALAFADAQLALAAATRALRWRGGWSSLLTAGGWASLASGFGPSLAEAFAARSLSGIGPNGGIGRVAWAATKADHVALRQRGNLAALLGRLTDNPGQTGIAEAHFAIASIRSTEDFVWSLDGHPVSAVRGRLLGSEALTRSYPGEVPDTPPDAAFFSHPFLQIPQFEPMRPVAGGRDGVPQLGLDPLLAFLLEDVL